MTHSRRAFVRRTLAIVVTAARVQTDLPESRVKPEHAGPRGGAATADRWQPPLCRGPNSEMNFENSEMNFRNSPMNFQNSPYNASGNRGSTTTMATGLGTLYRGGMVDGVG